VANFFHFAKTGSINRSNLFVTHRYTKAKYTVYSKSGPTGSPQRANALLIPGAARAGPEAWPAAAIVNSPVCARARVLCDGLHGLPLTSGQFIKVTEVRHEKRNEIITQIDVARV